MRIYCEITGQFNTIQFLHAQRIITVDLKVYVTADFTNRFPLEEQKYL